MRKALFVLLIAGMFTGSVFVAIFDVCLGIICAGITGLAGGLIASEWKSL